MEADGIRRRHPDYDDRQVLLAAARLRYGDDLVRAAWPREAPGGSVIDLAAAFRAVVAALDAIEAEYVVVGSTAAAGWGVARATRDVDLVAVIPADAVDALLSSLERDDLYVPSADVRRVVAGGGSFNVLHMASGGKVDVFVAPAGDAFERCRLDRRIASEVFGVRVVDLDARRCHSVETALAPRVPLGDAMARLRGDRSGPATRPWLPRSLGAGVGCGRRPDRAVGRDELTTGVVDRLTL